MDSKLWTTLDASVAPLHVRRYGVHRSTFVGGGAEGIRGRRGRKPPAHWVLLDIPDTTRELLFRRDLALVEAAHPHIELAFQAEREATLNELHRFLERDVGSGRDQSMEVVRHDHEGVQKEFSLASVVQDGSLKEFCRGRDLKESAPLSGYSGDQIRPSLLWRDSHRGSLNKRPVAKATYIVGPYSGA